MHLSRMPPPPTYRVINYEITNLELGKAIKKALEGESTPAADVYIGETPERLGWAIHMLFIRGEFDFEHPREEPPT